MTTLWPNPFQNKTVRIIDVETTGVKPGSKVVEIGSVDFANGNPHTNPMQTYVDPEVPIPFGAMKVHHITEHMVQGSPVIDDAVDDFKDADFYVAHNAKFDRKFLGKYFPNKPWICTYKLAMHCFPEMEEHNLQYLRYAMNLSPELVGGGHNAISDVTVAHALFCRILRHQEWDIQDLISISFQPRVYTTMPFGKHKGKPVRQVPPSYWRWLMNQDPDENIVATYESLFARPKEVVPQNTSIAPKINTVIDLSK